MSPEVETSFQAERSYTFAAADAANTPRMVSDTAGENETPAESNAPTPEDALASSLNRKGTPPIRTSSRSGRLVSGSIEPERETDHFLRASIPRRKPSTAASTRRRQVFRQRGAEVMLRLAVTPGGVVGLRELEANPGQPRPPREDRLESLGGALRHPELHLDSAEKEEPLDGLLLAGGAGLLEEYPRVLEPARPDKHPGGLHVGQPGRRAGRPGQGVGARTGPRSGT